MLRPRIIPFLLVHNKGLVKTINFARPKYVGDPLNAVRIFNEKKCDELAILDIDATVTNNLPDFDSIKSWASECRMPLCYGGGIKDLSAAMKILSYGVEKVSLSSAAISNPNLIQEISKNAGSQSVVVTIDLKKNFLGKYCVMTKNAKYSEKVNLVDLLKIIQDKGAGEIVINNIDLDGTMKGFDLKLLNQISKHISIPLTFTGGCGSLDDIRNLKNLVNPIGIGVGSLFVFKGKYKAVLINYPSPKEKLELCRSN